MEAFISADRFAVEQLLAQAIDDAFEAVPSAAKAELDRLSAMTLNDLRVQLLKSLGAEEREMVASVLTMRSSEHVGSRLVGATWALVGTTVGLVLSTVALVVVTLTHH